MPRPLKTLWYWPAKRSVTRWLVRIWIFRTVFSCSRESMEPDGARLRDGHALEDALHDLVGVDLLGLGLVGDDDAVAQHVGTDRLHVLWGDVATPLEEGMRLGSEGQVERRARGGAVLDERTQIQLVGLRLARGEDDADDVVLDLVVDVDLVDEGAGAEDLVGGNHRADPLVVLRHGHPVEDLTLLLPRRVDDAELQHEAVHLRLGQGVGSLLLDGVLRGEDEERV